MAGLFCKFILGWWPSRVPLHALPRLSKRWHLSCGVGQSERVSAMTNKVIALEFVVPTVLAVALGIALSAGAIYLTDRYFFPVNQAEVNESGNSRRGMADAPNPDVRFSRVRLLLR